MAEQSRENTQTGIFSEPSKAFLQMNVSNRVSQILETHKEGPQGRLSGLDARPSSDQRQYHIEPLGKAPATLDLGPINRMASDIIYGQNLRELLISEVVERS